MSTPAPLGWQAWLTLSLIIIGGFLLIRDIAPADMVFLGIDALLMITGVISVTEGTSGFAGSGVLTVAILMVASAGLTATGALGYFMSKLLGSPKTIYRALIRLLLPIALCSSFINDTPVFLMFVPIFQAWAPRLGDMVDPRQFYVPMSFTCLLAGTVTLIGTSTNIVVAGKAATAYPNLILPLFGITPVGIPVLFYGLAYILVAANYLLPNKARDKEAGMLSDRTARKKNNNGAAQSNEVIEGMSLKSMTLSCTVDATSPAIGKSIQGAELRNLQDIFLVAITRGDLTLHAVDPDVKIHAGDMLCFTGSPDHFVEICRTMNFNPITEDENDEVQESSIENGSAAKVLDGHLISVIVRDGSGLIGKTPKEVNFRKSYDASIISVQRAGKDIRDKPIGQLQLQVGDVLVLLTGLNFSITSDSTDFKLLSSGSVSQAKENPEMEENKYLVGARVIPKPRLKLSSSLNGKSIEEAGLRGLVGVSLVGITRKGNVPKVTSFAPNENTNAGEEETTRIIRAPAPSEVLQNGDILWFSGGRDAVQTIRKIPGLELLGESQAGKLKARSEQRRLIEVAIAPSSDLIGATVREIRFRTRFGAAVVAIRRGMTSASDELGNVANVKLQLGDVLMLDAGPDFIPRYGKDPNFLIANELVKSSPPQFGKFYIAFAAFLAMFITFIASSTKISLIPLGLIASGIMITFRVMTPQQARASVDWETLVVIAAAYGLSAAMENSKLANAIGSGLVDLAVKTGSGEAGIISALYIATMLISLFVANNAAALLMFTIGAAAQKKYGLDPYKMIYTIMLAASASFLIPYGYQTNIMSMSLGPYTPRQFMKFGIPLQILLTPLSIFTILFMEQWYINIIISIVLLIIVIIVLWMQKPKTNIPNFTANNSERNGSDRANANGSSSGSKDDSEDFSRKNADKDHNAVQEV